MWAKVIPGGYKILFLLYNKNVGKKYIKLRFKYICKQIELNYCHKLPTKTCYCILKKIMKLSS